MEHRKSRLRTNALLKFIAVILAVICFATCFFSAALTVTALKSNVYNDHGAKLLEDSIAGRTESLLYAFSRSLRYGRYEYVTEEATAEEKLEVEAESEAWAIYNGVEKTESAPTLVISEPKRLNREEIEQRLPNSIRPENCEYIFVIRDANGQIVYSSAELSEEEISQDYELMAHGQPLTLMVRDIEPTEIHRNCKSLDEVEEMLGVYRHFTGTLYCVTEYDGSYTKEATVLFTDGEIDEDATVKQSGFAPLMVFAFAEKMREEIDAGYMFLSTDYDDFLAEYEPDADIEYLVTDDEVYIREELKQAESEAYDKWESRRIEENKRTLNSLYLDYYDEACRKLAGTKREKYMSNIPRLTGVTTAYPLIYSVILDGMHTISFDLVGSYYAYPEQDFTVDTYFSLNPTYGDSLQYTGIPRYTKELERLNPTHGDSLQYTRDAVGIIADFAKFFPIVMLVSGLLLLILLFYLVLAAGEKRGCETAVAGWFDMIPLELFAIVDLVAAFCLIQEYLTLVYDCVFTNYSTYRLAVLAVLMAVPFAAGLAGVLSLMTLSTRIKARVLLKYSFVGVGLWLLKYIWKLIKRAFRLLGYLLTKIPLAWQCVVAIPMLAFADLILVCALCDGEDFAFFLWLMMWAAVGIIALAWCVGFKRVKKYAQGMKNGDISKEIDKKYLFGALKEHAEELESVDEGIKKAVDERMKSERFKTELIANVSHDLKTPLTSIVNYVDILSKDEIESPEAREHIDVLKRQAARMKKLIEDLVEVSKASSGTISANVERTDVNLLVTQTATEYAQRFESGKLELVMNMPEKKQIAELDGRLMWRVLDNLCNNICKYALAGTRVYITAEDLGESVRVSFKNISRFCLNMTGDELMERFVRGDSSRNTEGSGLGLSIAKSFCDLQKVGFDIVVDGDLFKVSLMIPKAADVEPDEDSDCFGEQEAAFWAGQRAHTVEEDPDSEEVLPIRETLPPLPNEPIMIPETPGDTAEAELNAPKITENDQNPALFDEKEGE